MSIYNYLFEKDVQDDALSKAIADNSLSGMTADEIAMAEIAALNRLTKGDNVSQDVTTRLRYMIQEVDGNTDRAFINNYVKNSLLARDSRALRKFIQAFTPDLDLRFKRYL